MSAEQVQDSYRPLLQQRGSYPANLRCKINLTGTRKTRLWGADGGEREPPQSWQGAMYAAKGRVLPPLPHGTARLRHRGEHHRSAGLRPARGVPVQLTGELL